MTTKSGKHANKTSGSAKDKSAKVVDMRKVAALSAGAAGVIAGAAIAFGATPAMAAETPTSAPVNTNDSAKEQNLVDANKGNSKTSDDSKATKKNEASKDETTNSEVKKEAKKEESKEAKEEPKKEQTKPAEQAVAKTDGNTDVTKTEAGSKVESIASVDNQDAKQDSEETGTPAGSVVNKRTRRSLDEKKQPEPLRMLRLKIRIAMLVVQKVKILIKLSQTQRILLIPRSILTRITLELCQMRMLGEAQTTRIA